MFMNKHLSVQEPFNINQVEQCSDFLGDTGGGQARGGAGEASAKQGRRKCCSRLE